MDADRLLAALVAATALVAFGVSAASLAAVGDDGLSPDVNEPADRETGEPPGPPESPDTCLLGCDGIRGALAGLLTDAPGEAVLGVAAVAAAVLAGFWWRTAGRPAEGDGDFEDVPTIAPPDVAEADVAVTAPPDAPPDNEVYRAWRELADSLDPGERGSLTPAEYAARARRRGYDEAAVETLTAVFRRVRYGGESVTTDREREAREAIDEVLGEGEP